MPQFPLAVTLVLVSLSLFGWLLSVGRALLLPFVIALLVWYLIVALAEAIRRIPLGPFRLPYPFALVAALAAIFGVSVFVVDVVTANLTDLARDAPVYQARLETLFNTYSRKLGLADPIELRDLVPDNALNRAIAAGANAITQIAGSASLVFIYVLFLLLEQSTFDRKMARLFSSPERAELAFMMRARITQALRNYLGIKTGVSVLTGLLTAGLLSLLSLPYAALFGFIAFALNFIPTIGSLTAVIFPSLLALVYFDSLTPFLVISLGPRHHPVPDRQSARAPPDGQQPQPVGPGHHAVAVVLGRHLGGDGHAALRAADRHGADHLRPVPGLAAGGRAPVRRWRGRRADGRRRRREDALTRPKTTRTPPFVRRICSRWMRRPGPSHAVRDQPEV